MGKLDCFFNRVALIGIHHIRCSLSRIGDGQDFSNILFQILSNFYFKSLISLFMVKPFSLFNHFVQFINTNCFVDLDFALRTTQYLVNWHFSGHAQRIQNRVLNGGFYTGGSSGEAIHNLKNTSIISHV